MAEQTRFSTEGLYEILMSPNQVKQLMKPWIKEFKKQNMLLIYETIVALHQILSGKHQLPLLKFNALLAVKLIFDTCEYVPIVLIEVYILPLIFQIASYRLQKRSEESLSDYFIQRGFDSNKQVKSLGLNYVLLAIQFVCLTPAVKPYRNVQQHQLKEQSNYVKVASLLKEKGLKHPSTFKFYVPSYIQSSRKRYQTKLSNFQPDQYVKFFKDLICQQFNLNKKAEIDTKKLLFFGDSYISCEILNICEQELENMTSNFANKKKYLSLINEFVRWGDIYAIILINSSQFLYQIYEEVIQVRGELGLNFGQAIYPNVEASKNDKREFYNEYLKCIEIWAYCIPTDQEGEPSECKTIYDDLKQEKKFIFPTNILLAKIKQQMEAHLKINTARNQKLVACLEYDPSQSSNGRKKGNTSMRDSRQNRSFKSDHPKNAEQIINIKELGLTVIDVQKKLNSLGQSESKLKEKFIYFQKFKAKWISDKQQFDLNEMDEEVDGSAILQEGDLCCEQIDLLVPVYKLYQKKLINFTQFQEKTHLLVMPFEFKHSCSIEPINLSDYRGQQANNQQKLQSHSFQDPKNIKKITKIENVEVINSINANPQKKIKKVKGNRKRSNERESIDSFDEIIEPKQKTLENKFGSTVSVNRQSNETHPLKIPVFEKSIDLKKEDKQQVKMQISKVENEYGLTNDIQEGFMLKSNDSGKKTISVKKSLSKHSNPSSIKQNQSEIRLNKMLNSSELLMSRGSQKSKKSMHTARNQYGFGQNQEHLQNSNPQFILGTPKGTFMLGTPKGTFYKNGSGVQQSNNSSEVKFDSIISNPDSLKIKNTEKIDSFFNAEHSEIAPLSSLGPQLHSEYGLEESIKQTNITTFKQCCNVDNDIIASRSRNQKLLSESKSGKIINFIDARSSQKTKRSGSLAAQSQDRSSIPTIKTFQKDKQSEEDFRSVQNLYHRVKSLEKESLSIRMKYFMVDQQEKNQKTYLQQKESNEQVQFFNETSYKESSLMLKSGSGYGIDDRIRNSQTNSENMIINQSKYQNYFPKTNNSERVRKAFLRNKTLMSKTDDLQIGSVTLLHQNSLEVIFYLTTLQQNIQILEYMISCDQNKIQVELRNKKDCVIKAGCQQIIKINCTVLQTPYDLPRLFIKYKMISRNAIKQIQLPIPCSFNKFFTFKAPPPTFTQSFSSSGLMSLSEFRFNSRVFNIEKIQESLRNFSYLGKYHGANCYGAEAAFNSVQFFIRFLITDFKSVIVQISSKREDRRSDMEFLLATYRYILDHESK